MPSYLRATNWNELRKRGARTDNAEYVMIRCLLCSCFALYDEECMQIYQSPRNLKSAEFYNVGDEVECRVCGKPAKYDYASEGDLQAVKSSPWAFAFD